MSQASLNVPTSGPVTPTAFAGDINNALDSIISKNSGASAPTNFPTSGGSATAFQDWADTTFPAFPAMKIFDGSQWVLTGYLDTANHLWEPIVGGGAGSIAGAGTTDIGSLSQSYIAITGGPASIASFGTSGPIGQVKFLLFFGTFTLVEDGVHIIVPANFGNIITNTNDTAIIVRENANLWRLLTYNRFNGQPPVLPILPSKPGTAQRFTSGSGNYTPSAGTTWIKVRMCGGGGATGNNGNGGQTSFGGWTANGGSQAGTGGTGGAGGTGGSNGTGSLIERANGGAGFDGFFFSNSGNGSFIHKAFGGFNRFGGGPNSGAGGGGSENFSYNNNSHQFAGGGGAGEYVEFIVTSPGVIAYSVGAGASLAQAGVIVIEEFYL